MKRMKGRLLTVLLSLAMAFAMMPMMSQPAYAAEHPGIELVDRSHDLEGIAGGQTSGIYFGHYPQSEAANVDGLTEGVDYVQLNGANYLIEPVRWRVLDVERDDNGKPTGKLLLLSDQNLDCKQYNEEHASITWKDSTIRDWLNNVNDGFMKDAFSEDEQKAIATTKVHNKLTDEYTPNPDYPTVDGGSDTEDQVFLLSIGDARNTGYGFTNNYNATPTREAKNTAYATGQGAWTSASGQYAGNGYWWLRSPGLSDDIAAIVDYDGYLYYPGYYVDYVNYAVRPALKIDLYSAIFTSAAPGGKTSDVGAGSLEAPGLVNENVDWKLTLKDGAHENFKVDSVTTCDGKTLTIQYSGAAADGKKEYISAIIKDKNGILKSYGKLALASDAEDASAKVNIDGKMQDGDKLCVFNEQCNGDYETDFSSPLRDVTIPTQLHDWKDATCADPKTCKECGVTEADPLGHKYGAWTKLDADQHQRVCEHDVTHVEKENHKWDTGKVTKAATEQAEGVKTFTCTVCKATKTETMPKLKPSAPKVSGTPLAKLTAKSKSITIRWNKIQGAAGYDIFFARCNHDGRTIIAKKVKTVKGNKTFKWTKSGLKKGTAYKAYVRAYVYKNGKKTYVSKSPIMHAYTGNGTKKYTNAKSVTIKNVKKGKLSLKKGKTFKIKAKVKKVKKNKKLMPKSHAPALRYMTSNSKIASVNSGGKITAKGKGTCYIYGYAHNGVSKQIKLIVK